MGSCTAVGAGCTRSPRPHCRHRETGQTSPSKDGPASHRTWADPCCNHHVHTKGRRPAVLTCEPGPGQTAVLNFSFCRRDF